MTLVENYRVMIHGAHAAGYAPTAKALRELYGDGGEIIYDLQARIDKLRAPSLDELLCIIRAETGCGYGEGDKAAAALLLKYWPASEQKAGD